MIFKSRQITILVFALGAFYCVQSWASMVYDYTIDLGGGYTLNRLNQDSFMFRAPDIAEILTIDTVWHHRKLTGYCKLDKVILAKTADLDEKGQLIPDRKATYFIISTQDNTCTEALTETTFQESLAKISLDDRKIDWVAPQNPYPLKMIYMYVVCNGIFWIFNLILFSGMILPVPFLLIKWHYSKLEKQLRILEVAQEKTPPQSIDQVTGTGSI